ncbi:hypothetical protein MACK_002153 [Theileria orientalis]|uniref:Uncharacterized protein n=1 Tax=Theileria orientalis TaxID=68886 RepID=A0A976QUT1_THEOR|nr:hypothetical protein MACK_002153 [Theileria orientalis]
MKTPKPLNDLIKLKYRRLLARNLTYTSHSIGTSNHINIIRQYLTYNSNISPGINQIRYVSTSSVENTDSGKSTPVNSVPSDDYQRPENLLCTEEFLKLLKWTWDKNSNLMRLIQKCKDELTGLSISSYPFKRHEVRVLVELLSGVLSLQSNKTDVDLLCKLLDSHKINNKLTFGLDFCKLFSSSYESISKVHSPMFTRLMNKAMMVVARYFVPNVIESTNEKNLKGVKFAFNSVSESINNQNFDILEQCCNDKLFKYIKNGIDFLNSLNLKINLNIKSIDDLVMDKFYLTIGGSRDDVFSDMLLNRASGINPVIITKSGPPKTPDEYRTMIMKCFEKGAVMRMEVLLNTTQSLTLMDENDEVMWSDFKPLCTHRLCFESEFKLSSELKPGKKVDFDTGDWVLVDINGVLNNNNPL